MRSRIYECHVMHARFQPRAHRFVYRLFMLAVDLDELPMLDRTFRLFSVNRRNVFDLRESDFLPTNEPIHHPSNPSASHAQLTPPPIGLKPRVLAFAAAHGIAVNASTRVELITLPRMLGYRFNPVSFYFLSTAQAPLAAICEVTNTFHEIKPYLLSGDNATTDGFRLRVPKHFYVSPFSDVDVEFDFHLRIPGPRFAVQIDDYIAGTRTFTSSLTGPSRPLTDRALAWFLLKYPLLTVRVIALIHWHAFLLWFKNVPWFAKAARPSDQRDLYRPHDSLTKTP